MCQAHTSNFKTIAVSADGLKKVAFFYVKTWIALNKFPAQFAYDKRLNHSAKTFIQQRNSNWSKA